MTRCKGRIVRGGCLVCGVRHKNRKDIRLAGLLGALLAGILLATAVPAWGSSPLSWASPVPIDDQAPFVYPAEVNGVSCPSTGLCVAVDGVGDVLVSTSPRGGTGAWARTRLTEGFDGVSCPSAELCVAVGSGVIATSADPAGGAGAWSVANVSRDLKAVSCASVSLCVATDGNGDVWTSIDPAGGAGAWSEAHIDEEALGGVSCPSVKLCVAVDGQYGDVLTSTDPTGGVGAWTETDVDSDHTLYDVSCSSESLCVASDNYGDLLTSTDPTGGANAWSAAHVSGGLIEHVSCASWGLCVAMTGNEVITSTQPTGGAGAWTSTPIETVNRYGGDESLQGASCPAAGLCVLVDSGSEVITAANPVGGAAAWTITPVEVGHSDLQGVSCASLELCVWVDDAGNVVTSVDPGGGSGAWVGRHIDAHALNGVSCPSTGLCVAVDDAGDVLTSTDPTGGAGAWSIANVDGAIPLNEVSCASVHLCVAIDREGGVVSSNDPTGGPGAWGVAQVGDASLDGVSCPSEGLCALADGVDVITSTEPAGGASKWTARDVDAGSLGRISCPSVSLCVATGERPEAVLSWGDPVGSSSWTETYFADLNGLGKISCAAGGPCVATSFGGEGSPGNVAISSAPASGAGTWVMGNVYGEPVGVLAHRLNLFIRDMAGVSCIPEGMCIVGDTEGRVMVGTPQSANALENTALPVISGTPATGETLICADGTWTGEPAPTFTYQWLRGGSPISSATGNAYVVQADDAGEDLACEVTATNSTEHKSATSSGVSVAATTPEDTAVPVVSGTPAVGETLTCANGTWTGGPSPMFAVQWSREDVPIPGATGSTYDVQAADVEASLTCEVTATNSAGRKSATTSGVFVVATMPENTVGPMVSGTPAVGETLTCSDGTWTGEPPPTFTEKWLRDSTPISDAMGSRYQVQAADMGEGLSCEVTATSSAGYKSAISNTLQVPQAPSGGGSSGGGSLGGGTLGGSDSAGTLTGTVSNTFVLNGVESVATHGTVELTLTLPWPGTLQIVGRASAAQLAGVSPIRKKHKSTLVIAQLRVTVSKAGRIVVTLVPTASTKAVLARRGKLSATVTITYTPKGGVPRSIVRAVTFRLHTKHLYRKLGVSSRGELLGIEL
jgi:hypothetical protein